MCNISLSLYIYIYIYINIATSLLPPPPPPGVTVTPPHRGTFSVLPLPYLYLPKSARAHLFVPNLSKFTTFAAALLVLTPFVRDQLMYTTMLNQITSVIDNITVDINMIDGIITPGLGFSAGQQGAPGQEWQQPGVPQASRPTND